MELRCRKRPLSTSVFAVALVLSTTASTVVQGSEDVDCGPSLSCQNGGLCKQGDASWPGTTAGNRLPSSLNGTNVEGHYCECAPVSTSGRSFTGLSCEIPYQECRYTSGFAVCYHGGSCLDEAPTSWDDNSPVCNCGTADLDGAQYGGRNCEVVTNQPNPCQEYESYCMNGGVCSNEPDPTTGFHCQCPPGFTGRQCQTAVVKPQGDCNLKCHHDGVCQFTPTTAEGENQPLWGSLDGMYCQCLTGFSGVQCEHIAQQCGDELVCLHGSTCFEITEQNKFECRCAPSDYYIGGVCISGSDETSGTTGDQLSTRTDHSRVTHCNPTSEMEFIYGMAIPSFCANGGTCREELIDGLL